MSPVFAIGTCSIMSFLISSLALQSSCRGTAREMVAVFNFVLAVVRLPETLPSIDV